MGKKMSTYQGLKKEKIHEFIKCKTCKKKVDLTGMIENEEVEKINGRLFFYCPECEEQNLI